MKPWPIQTDQGRYQVTKHETHKGPALRLPRCGTSKNVAPYFHDGSVPTLDSGGP